MKNKKITILCVCVRSVKIKKAMSTCRGPGSNKFYTGNGYKLFSRSLIFIVCNYIVNIVDNIFRSLFHNKKSFISYIYNAYITILQKTYSNHISVYYKKRIHIQSLTISTNINYLSVHKNMFKYSTSIPKKGQKKTQDYNN